MPPVPILFTIPNFITAGSGQVLVNIASRLDKSQFEPFICVTRKGGRLDEVVKNLGIPLIENPFDIPIKPYSSLFYRAREAAQFFRPYKFRLWHSFHYSDTYTEALVARFSGVNSWIYTKKAMGWGSRAWLLKSYMATHIVADNTDMIKDMFNRPGLRHKISYIPHGVLSQEFTPNTKPVLNLKKQQGLSDGTPVIVTVAHLVPVKGHPTLIEGIAKIPNAHLWVAGKPLDADYAAALHAQVGSLGLTDRVHFLGDVENIPALLAEADIAVLPTWARWRMEGCPVALLEAMACGKACIASDIPGARDLIVHEESGLLIPPEDSQALASAIDRLIQDPDLRAQYGRSARSRIEEHFTIEHEVAQHEALYRKVLKI